MRIALIKSKDRDVRVDYERHVDTGEWRVRLSTADGKSYWVKHIFPTYKAAKKFMQSWADSVGIEQLGSLECKESP